ncbi:hypothetical protein VUR80DRAFT_10033 [Thermomyces stellatus]
MDTRNAPPLASTPDHARGDQSGPRARKKLQKTVGLPPTLPPNRRLTASRTANNGKKPKPRVKAASRQGSGNKARQPSLRAIPDLSDAKWLDYVRSQSEESLKLPTLMIRDISYLSIAKPPHHTLHRPKSKMSTTRRRAKTPVFSIGQLEGLPLKGYATPARASIDDESIADQYERLVEECDRHSIYSDTHSEPPPSRLGYREEEYEPRRQRSSNDLPSNRLFSKADCKNPSGATPTSEDGTLVSFEEETVYFKPVSFSPEPRSPSHAYGSSFDSNATNRLASPSNLSLQICLDLLTRELSSAVSDRRQRPGNEISALQVWVMIEAFERLRDQVAEMRLGVGGVSGVEEMFETWIRALYAVHDSLAGEAGVEKGWGSCV